MSKRKGPFSLRLSAELISWLQYEAKQHSRSTTSEAIFLLQNSLTLRFDEAAVHKFKHQNPTTSHSECFGLRIPDEVKTQLREFSQQHSLSLNHEIVMRLTRAYEKQKQHAVTNNISKVNDALPSNELFISDEEEQLLVLFRGLNETNKKVILTLIQNLVINE